MRRIDEGQKHGGILKAIGTRVEKWIQSTVERNRREMKPEIPQKLEQMQLNTTDLKLLFREFHIKFLNLTIGAHTYWLVTDCNFNPLIEYHGMAIKAEAPQKALVISGGTFLENGDLVKVFRHSHAGADNVLTYRKAHNIFESHSLYNKAQPFRVVTSEREEVINIIESFERSGSIWNSKTIEYNILGGEYNIFGGNSNNTRKVSNSNGVTFTLGCLAVISNQIRWIVSLVILPPV
ncbi:hypothetical protein phytr_1430 [Candidatus Phycorickettsia trachydisci]|uniref:Uncharacterized protein n=1 Tax=Candidatus Phycorickettsia trachydisci TaxID=2115978 RepID=A0A2P1P752_9RICK|nr:hypothetical protein [Candidatus Phycorickettsia trachydisci]AVP87102.1 hypothetical protein phytr_1430 [Candidatus Phycorickettsia trachydisci]